MSYVEGFVIAAPTANKQEVIDFSARMGWPYSLVDANWNTIRESALEDLTRYAAAKGVGLLFWYNSGGPHNWVQEEPRNLMHERSASRAVAPCVMPVSTYGTSIPSSGCLAARAYSSVSGKLPRAFLAEKAALVMPKAVATS